MTDQATNHEIGTASRSETGAATRSQSRSGFVPRFLTPQPNAAKCGGGQRVNPMWTIRGLISLLDLSEDEILARIEAGELLWAFNFGLSIRNREIRVLPQAVTAFQNGVACKLEWEDVEKNLLSEVPQTLCGTVPVVTSLQIQRLCNLSVSHVSTLCETKHLTVVKAGRCGPNGSAQISSASFLRFVRKRRLL